MVSPHLIWRDIESGVQVRRSFVRARILTATYTLQSNQSTFSHKTVDPSCPHCQLEDDDIHHVVCRCPAFYEYRVSVLSQFRQAVIEAGTWNENFTGCRILFKTIVCPEYLNCCNPNLSSIIQETEIIAREFFHKIHIENFTLLMKKEVVAAVIDLIFLELFRI